VSGPFCPEPASVKFTHQGKKGPDTFLPRVRVLGFEPRTSALSELRSSQLSYTRSNPAGNKKAKPIKVWPYPDFGDWIERQPSSRLLIIRWIMNTLPSAENGNPAIP
jgi:hypothetical protein